MLRTYSMKTLSGAVILPNACRNDGIEVLAGGNNCRELVGLVSARDLGVVEDEGQEGQEGRVFDQGSPGRVQHEQRRI